MLRGYNYESLLKIFGSLVIVSILFFTLTKSNSPKKESAVNVISLANDASEFNKPPKTTKAQTTTKTENQLEVYKSLLSDLSAMLTNAHKRIGQLTCEKNNEGLAESGGYCRNKTVHFFDVHLARALSSKLKGKRVTSFGDGSGEYKEKLLAWGEIASYDAFDGAPYSEEISGGLVKFLDLTAPIYHLGQYDWVISLEVAEHIPAAFEAIYISNLKRHAKEGIIVSWAKPGQPGIAHVNGHELPYVIEAFESSSEFKYDREESIKLRNASSFDWFRNNTAVFNRIKTV